MAERYDDLKLKNDVLQGMITEINESISAFDVAEEKNIYRLLGRIETISRSMTAQTQKK